MKIDLVEFKRKMGKDFSFHSVYKEIHSKIAKKLENKAVILDYLEGEDDEKN